MKKILIGSLFIIQLISIACAKKYDLTVVGRVNFVGSLERQTIGLIDCLKDKVAINFVATRPSVLDGLSSEIKKVLREDNKAPGNVAVLEDSIWYHGTKAYDNFPDSKIKIAYSMCESTAIHDEWVKKLNSFFDAVVVPDDFLVPIYKNSGVEIPIFTVPLGIYAEEFLHKPLRKEPGKPFTFGCCSSFFARKNHRVLVDAFIQEFGKNNDVKLVLHGGDRGKFIQENHDIIAQIEQSMKKHRVSNIEISSTSLAWADYIALMESFDCYINISKGEGFSVPPRESLALGMPAIITNNTAQTTICDTGFVRSVPSTIAQPACYSKLLGAKPVGEYFSCSVDDVRCALRDVYTNYEHHRARAEQGRSWAAQFLWKNLQKKYLNLVKPQKIIFGDNNIITDEYLMTNSRKLYEKYKNL